MDEHSQVRKSRNYKKCVICNKRRIPGSNVYLARMPLNPDRCRKWVKAIGQEDLVHIPIEKLHQLKFVCNIHFQKEDFNESNTRLLEHAVPTLNLPSKPLEDNLFIDFPLHIGQYPRHLVQESSQINQENAPLHVENVVPQSADNEMSLSAPTCSRYEKSYTLRDVTNLGSEIASTEAVANKKSVIIESVAVPGCSHDEISVQSHTRKRKSAEETKPTLTNREKRLFIQLQNAKKTIKNLAKSRVDLDKLNSEMLTSIVKGVLNNQKKKPQGKRWSLENKIYALAIFKRSPKAYRYIQKLIKLPSVKTLQRILKDIPMGPGINLNIIDILKTKAANMSQNNKFCSLLFDEMALKKRLIYNEISDKIEGYVDFGPGESMGRENKIADHVLVFMIQGLKFKYKQYIAHYFVEGTISTQKLSRIIIDIIKKLKDIGFTVLATVCDQGSTNIGALNMLKKKHGNIEDNFFKVDNEKIYTVYDIPHLFKSLRNNFHKAAKMKYAGKTAQWKHLLAAEERNRNFLNFKKLNATVVNPTYKTKMRVKYAVHALSNTMAAILKMMAWKEDKEVNDTAFVIEELDKLLDCTNGPSSFKDVKKGIRENVSMSSTHVESWNYYIKNLDTIQFFSSQDVTLKNVKCIKGYKISIKSLIDIWETLQKAGFKYLNLRQLNQDSLENLFGIIRQHGVTNKNPTVTHFTSALKTSMVSGLKVPHSRNANCEADYNKCLIEYKDILKNKMTPVTMSQVNIKTSSDEEMNYPVLSIPDPENNEQYCEDLCTFENQPVVYVSGYLAAKLLQQNSCTFCKQFLKVENPTDDMYAYISFREWWQDTKSLTYPTKELCNTVNNAKKFYHDNIAEQLYVENIGNFTFLLLSTNVDFKWFECKDHYNNIHDNFFKIISYLFIRKSCKMTNDSFVTKENDTADKSKKAQQQSIEK